MYTIYTDYYWFGHAVDELKTENAQIHKPAWRNIKIAILGSETVVTLDATHLLRQTSIA